MGHGLPKIFLEEIFYARINLLKRFMKGEQFSFEKLVLEFTRTTPAVITYGPAGLSGSIKMVGFVPRKELIEEQARKAVHYAYDIDRPLGLGEVSRILLEEFYREDLLDLKLIGGLEMGFRHSWTNIRATRRATLLYFIPPDTSFEVRCSVDIHDDSGDPYKIYLNALHDMFHKPRRGRSNYPAYVFHIEEIYDNSNTREGFGRMIYPITEPIQKTNLT